MKFQNISFVKKKDLIYILLCLYPWLLISGPFLSDTTAIILSIYLITEKYLQNNFDIFKNIFFIIFCIFCAYLILNSIFIGKTFLSLKASLFYLRFAFFILAINFILNENSYRIKYFFLSLFITILFLFSDGIFQKLFGFNLFGIDMYHSIRVSSLFKEELILGSYTIKLLPITLALLYFISTKKKLLFSTILIILSLALILISAEKTALIMSILFIILYIIKLNLNYKLRILLFVFFSFLITSTLFFNDSLQKRIVRQFITNNASGKYIYTAVHDSHYKTAFKMFKEKPLFGHGPKMFRIKCSDPKYKINQFSCSTHPHNYILQLLAETGVVGIFFWLLFYLSILKIFFKILIFENSKNDLIFSIYLMSCSVLIIFLPIAPSGNLFNNWISCINSFSIGTMLYFLSQKNKT